MIETRFLTIDGVALTNVAGGVALPGSYLAYGQGVLRVDGHSLSRYDFAKGDFSSQKLVGSASMVRDEPGIFWGKAAGTFVETSSRVLTGVDSNGFVRSYVRLAPPVQ